MKKKSFSAKDTSSIACAIGKEALGKPRGKKHALVFTLQGELGAGKTTFAQGFASGLGVREKVTSPTFVIIKSYDVPLSEKRLYHIDCYRLESAEDFTALGWQDIVQEANNIVLVEWPEKVAGILPLSRTAIVLSPVGKNQREIYVTEKEGA
jgi:tRNA threonylcarbamoyladenosine biosynthesis protein TsaE